MRWIGFCWTRRRSRTSAPLESFTLKMKDVGWPTTIEFPSVVNSARKSVFVNEIRSIELAATRSDLLSRVEGKLVVAYARAKASKNTPPISTKTLTSRLISIIDDSPNRLGCGLSRTQLIDSIGHDSLSFLQPPLDFVEVLSFGADHHDPFLELFATFENENEGLALFRNHGCFRNAENGLAFGCIDCDLDIHAVTQSIKRIRHFVDHRDRAGFWIDGLADSDQTAVAAFTDVIDLIGNASRRVSSAARVAHDGKIFLENFCFQKNGRQVNDMKQVRPGLDLLSGGCFQLADQSGHRRNQRKTANRVHAFYRLG